MMRTILTPRNIPRVNPQPRISQTRLRIWQLLSSWFMKVIIKASSLRILVETHIVCSRGEPVAPVVARAIRLPLALASLV